MLAVSALSYLLSPDQDFAQNEALLDALNIDRSSYDRSSPDAYMVSMLTDSNLVARDVALRSLYREDIPGWYSDRVVKVATISEPIKNILLEIAANDDYFALYRRPRPRTDGLLAPPNFGDEVDYFAAPFRNLAIKALNANGIAVKLDENQLIYEGLAWLGRLYVECETDADRNTIFFYLRALDPTHPAIIYAQQKAQEAAGSDNPRRVVKSNSQELLEVFKFLVEATPEMWKEALEGMSVEAVVETPTETAEPSIAEVAPQPEPTPQPTASPDETVKSPSFPFSIWLVPLAVALLAGIGYVFYRRKRGATTF